MNVIKNPSETENRIVFVASAALSQNEILAAFERVTGKKWMVNKASTEEMPEVGKKAIVGGNASEGWLNIVKYILFTDKEELGSNYKAKDNELLGVKTLDAAGIEQVIRGVVGA